MSKKKFVNPGNTKARPTGSYGAIIADIAKAGVCPFCPEHLSTYHKRPIEKRGHWLVTDNMYPVEPSLHHRLVIHEEHVTHMDELSPEAWKELFEIVQIELKRGSIAGGTLVMRFGDTRYTGASVSHLHAHLVQSNPDDPTYDPAKGIIVRIG